MLRRVLLSQVPIALLFSVVALSATASAQMARSVTGNWQVQSTGDEFHSGTVSLTQQGTSVVGTYSGTGTGVHVSGKLSNGVMSGTWRGSNGAEAGWLTIFFRENGRGFNGEWGYHGRPPNGQLVGTRM